MVLRAAQLTSYYPTAIAQLLMRHFRPFSRITHDESGPLIEIYRRLMNGVILAMNYVSLIFFTTPAGLILWSAA